MTVCSPISRADARTGNSTGRGKDANEGDSPGGAEFPGPAVAGVGTREGPRDDAGLGFSCGSGDDGADVSVVLPHAPSAMTQTSTRARRLSIRCGPWTGLRRDGRGRARRIAAIVDVAPCGVWCMGTFPTPGEPSCACATQERSQCDARPQKTFCPPRCHSGFAATRAHPGAMERSARAARIDAIATRGHQGPLMGLPEVAGRLRPRRPTPVKKRLGVVRATRTPESGTLSAVRVHGWQFGHARREASLVRRGASPGAPRGEPWCAARRR
jgi:hypothetical protein